MGKNGETVGKQVEQFNINYKCKSESIRINQTEIGKRFQNAIHIADSGPANMGWRDVRTQLDKYMPVTDFPKILVIGCGIGSECYFAQKGGYDVTEITLSEYNYIFAKEQLGLERVYRADIHCTEFPDNFFDSALCYQTFEHFISPVLALVEIYRILRNHGILLLELPPPQFMSETMGGLSHILCPTPRQLKSLLEGTGFEIIEIFLYDSGIITEVMLDCCNQTFQVVCRKELSHGLYSNIILGR